MVPGKARTLAGDYITSVGFVGETTVEKGLNRWAFIAAVLFFTCSLGLANAEDLGDLAPGEHKYEFSGWSERQNASPDSDAWKEWRLL